MTTTQLHLFNGFYLVVLAIVAILTRATPRRIEGAMAGGAAIGLLSLVIIPIGERAGWWHFALSWEPYFLTLMEIDSALTGFVFLITWRIARRFGGRGLVVAALIAMLIGPVRDYWAATKVFPQWGGYGPGIAPVLAISGGYVLVGIVGHGVMRLVAGPAEVDRLARRPWEPRQSSAV